MVGLGLGGVKVALDARRITANCDNVRWIQMSGER